MLKISGLDKLQDDLRKAQEALNALHGELGTVKFDPNDPASVDAAIQHVDRRIDEKVAGHAANPLVKPVIEQMKAQYRDGIRAKAAAARSDAAS